MPIIGRVGHLPGARRSDAAGDPRRAHRAGWADALRALHAPDHEARPARRRGRPSRSTSTSSRRPGLVRSRRQGRYRFHDIDTAPLLEIVERWPPKEEGGRSSRSASPASSWTTRTTRSTSTPRVLGFVKKTEVPLGEHRWLTVVSPEDPDGAGAPARAGRPPRRRRRSRTALVADGIPFTSFAVDDVRRRARAAGRAGRQLHATAADDGAGHDGGPRRHLRQPHPDRQHGLTRLRPPPGCGRTGA